MALSPTLTRYLQFEAELAAIHGDTPADNAARDACRDRMDGVWRALSAEDREWLDGRTVEVQA